ncbi:MAG: double-strand break repair helicase AddA [Alphaproteobacteria bacterium]|nr:double-strand break repair helicase AddA [Alphaproteobacteria bacterium]
MTSIKASASQNPDPVRDIDPQVRQRLASHPDHSVWVAASAGSGKTKVLIDRLLRLLLPRPDGRPGTPPARILAITFTKAGANEMSLRLTQKLAEWSSLPETELIDNHLTPLLGHAPTPEMIQSARRLFAHVTETPGGLNIMTIHSFCQSVLSRFPLEAGLSPHFDAIDDTESRDLIIRARDQVLAQAETEKGSPLADSLDRLARIQNEDFFATRLQDILKERHAWQKIKQKHFNIEGLYTALCQFFDIKPGEYQDDIIRQACVLTPDDEARLRQAVTALASGTAATDQPKGQNMQRWLDASPPDRARLFHDYTLLYLTQSGEIRAKQSTQSPQKHMPDIAEVLTREAQRLYDVKEQIRCADCAQLTADMLRWGDAVLARYQTIKELEGRLDFDDMILKTLHLLTGKSQPGLKDITPWVMYKLDGGLDHILIDEAQDTNPEQWEIIQALCQSFFDGQGARDVTRTLFVVGDEKQSIFSFQRAAPEKMAQMRDGFTRQIESARQVINHVPFNISFRSAPAILTAVDSVITQDHVASGLGTSDILPHIAHRRLQAGRVEIWPVFKNDPEDEETDFSAPPLQVTTAQKGSQKLADHIAENIRSWIGHEMLPSRGRPIEAGDILILVRTRTAFVGQLMRALKQKYIPVSGVDRMVLSEQLAIQDLMNAAQCALNPQDDLAICCLLTSPFIGWSDAQVFEVAHDRGAQSVWDKINVSGHEHVASWILSLSRSAGRYSPFEFFSNLLNFPCPASNISGYHALYGRLGEDAKDPVDELLNDALHFGRENPGSLQLFVQAQAQAHHEIKRELEEAGKAVRIMTVHGAKGLQAPIVILPDTIHALGSAKTDPILWPSRTSFPLPFFLPAKNEAPARLASALDAIAQSAADEYRRLLYVAMTRAEDRLYVGGYQTKKDIKDGHWYDMIKTGVEKIPGCEYLTSSAFTSEPILRFENLQEVPPDKIRETISSESDQKISLPDWIYALPPDEPAPAKPLTPSRPSLAEPSAASPLISTDLSRFRRGHLTHRLLEHIPGFPPGRQLDIAQAYLKHMEKDLNPDIAASIVGEVMGILTHPEYAPLFGPGSVAEIPISGMIDAETLISGQIDRLVVTNDSVLIIDYKTNRPPPQDEKDIPHVYRRQMDAYARTLALIYPGKIIKTYLLWTQGARMMPLS